MWAIPGAPPKNSSNIDSGILRGRRLHSPSRGNFAVARSRLVLEEIGLVLEEEMVRRSGIVAGVTYDGQRIYSHRQKAEHQGSFDKELHIEASRVRMVLQACCDDVQVVYMAERLNIKLDIGGPKEGGNLSRKTALYVLGRLFVVGVKQLYYFESLFRRVLASWH